MLVTVIRPMAILIAEFCQNHNGDRAVIKEMIAAAHASGATYAKIQTIFSEDLTRRERFEDGKTHADGTVATLKRPFLTEQDRLRPMDLTPDDYAWFIEECGRVGIKPLTTVFTLGRVADMAKLGWKDVKVASYDCASLVLLKQLKHYFSHLFISTGATHDWEVARTAHLLRDHSFSFLHCVTVYPTPLPELHLRRMRYLRQYTPSVGFSDHTLIARDGIKASLMALAMGAEVIERHFTVLPPEQTKDGPVSITPAHLQELVTFAKLPVHERLQIVKDTIPEWRQTMGYEQRDLSPTELLNRDYYRGRFATHTRSPVWNWDAMDDDGTNA